MRGSAAYAHLWGTPEIHALLDDEPRLRAWLHILGQLAAAQAELELIPASAAEEIAGSVRVEILDMDHLVAQTQATGHSLLGLIQTVQQVVSPAAGEWFCFGATVQDVTDTWFALLMRDIAAIVERDLLAIEDSLVALAERHRDTPMTGRTHGQPGLPITAGLKAATWAGEIGRHLDRLAEGRRRWPVAQLAGAVGTLSFWGDKAFDLQERFAARLGLLAPEGPWLNARDRLAEFGCLLALIAQTLGRIGNEILELQRGEIAEWFEPFVEGEVGSITMPHKRNPERSEHLVTLAKVARAEAALLVEAMVGEHERDGRSWKTEWAAAPDLFLATGRSLAIARGLLAGLDLRPARMAANLAVSGEYLHSEAVMLELAAHLGKQSAHRLVYGAAMRGVEEGTGLRRALEETPEVVALLSKEDLDRLFEATLSTGRSAALVDRAVAAARRSRAQRVQRAAPSVADGRS